MTVPQLSLTFTKSQRLLAKGDFDRAYALRCKASDGTLLMFAVANGAETTRLGLSVSRKVGNAVARNRVKRLLREAFRLEQHRLPHGLDLVVIPLDARKATLPTYRQGLAYLARKLRKRLDANIADQPVTAPEPATKPSDTGAAS